MNKFTQMSTLTYANTYKHILILSLLRYIQVTSSTHEAKVGEFAVFHVRTNFHAEHFVYMVSP